MLHPESERFTLVFTHQDMIDWVKASDMHQLWLPYLAINGPLGAANSLPCHVFIDAADLLTVHFCTISALAKCTIAHDFQACGQRNGTGTYCN